MYYLVILVLLFGVELFYFRIADKCNIIDKPNERSSHIQITLRGGGIIFYFGALIYFLTSGFEYPLFMLALTLVAFISFVDDIKSVNQLTRLLFHFTAMLLMFGQWELFSSSWWWIIAALIVCTGIVNAYNFMDGINGITGGYSIAVLIPLIYLNGQNEFVEQPYLYVMGLSLLVFCFFNFRERAKCFAGDVGSISIAFMLLFAIGLLIFKTQDFAYIVFLVIYGTDAVLTICHRILLHENLGEAHRKHAYQLMANELKIPHVKVSLLYMGTQLVISFGMLIVPINHYVYLCLIVCVLVCAYIVFIRKNYHLHEAYLKSKQL